MEQTVEEKIQAAIQPLLDRIAALETQQQLFQQEIASLQTVHASKIPQKPGTPPHIQPLNPRQIPENASTLPKTLRGPTSTTK